MADEPDDTDPHVLRNRLLMQAERGELTKEQAEAAAAAHGLEPFERRPELPRFDPKAKSHWSIVMSVAWIAWRDFEMVREQDPEFCSACLHWIYRKWNDSTDKTAKPVKRGGNFLETRLAPTVSRLVLRDGLLRGRGNVPPTAVMTVREAVAALWQALSENRLIAQGFDVHGTVVEIPSREWVYLRLRDERGRDVLRYDAVSQPEPFTAVTLGQSDVLRLWPVSGEFPVLPATVIDKAHSRRWQVSRIQWALHLEFPDGVPPNVPAKEIQRLIGPLFKDKSWKPPSIDSIARARGRRKVG
ncbi:hypothetical protein ACH79_05115 [Bradyrhizobium sp. CCBAU 051011]|uniref:hypothetical protein n=1 Tax=Bradyrhizobium sp. CCBAU 051011 TaxID=858422 RepID=UPI00137442A7|nr:hypothetical protein [Bradyrhizobium sp. CCBAU 051011]QHO72086.1 hypothetical protein ACH79_05115 [Bradyrhizobium sp. CCBAU 051011]